MVTQIHNQAGKDHCPDSHNLVLKERFLQFQSLLQPGFEAKKRWVLRQRTGLTWQGAVCFSASSSIRISMVRETEIYTFTFNFMEASCSWMIRAFELKLWLHISMRGSIMGTLVGVPSVRFLLYKRNALDETAAIAHPRDDASTVWPPKGWFSGFILSRVRLTSFSKSRRKRHLLFTWLAP